MAGPLLPPGLVPVAESGRGEGTRAHEAAGGDGQEKEGWGAVSDEKKYDCLKKK